MSQYHLALSLNRSTLTRPLPLVLPGAPSDNVQMRRARQNGSAWPSNKIGPLRLAPLFISITGRCIPQRLLHREEMALPLGTIQWHTCS